jgi:hypothetical protein
VVKRLVAGLSLRRPGFAPGSIHVGFVVDRVAMGQVFLRVLRFSPVNNIPPLLHIHLPPPHEVCDSSDQAAHCHHLGPKLGASCLTRNLGWKHNKKVKKLRRGMDGACSTYVEVAQLIQTVEILERTLPLGTYSVPLKCIRFQTFIACKSKSKAVPLHAMEAFGGRGGIAPTHSRPRH